MAFPKEMTEEGEAQAEICQGLSLLSLLRRQLPLWGAFFEI